MSRRRNKRRRARRPGRTLVGADGVLPKEQRLPPMAFLARMVLTIQSAPRQRVVDLAFDAVCRLHGYIPMKVLTFMLDERLVFLDDRHAHKVIGLTEAGMKIGASRRLDV